MESKRNGALLGLPDRFVAVEIETEASPAFDATQYSFFGDLSAADSGLEGALEDGLEAPPPEEGPPSQDYGYHGPEEEALPLDEEEDLSVASIFRTQLGLGTAKSPPKRADQDEDAALDALLTDPLSVARKQLRDDDYDHRGLPSELFSQGPSASQAAVTADQPQPMFGTPPTSYGLFDGFASAQVPDAHPAATAAAAPQALQPQPQPSPQHQPSPTVPPISAGSALLQMLKKPTQPPQKAMTLEELEARMLGNAQAAAGTTEGTQPGAGALAGVAAPLSAQAAAAAPMPGMAGARPLPGPPVSFRGPPAHLAGGPAAVYPGAYFPHMQQPAPPPGAAPPPPPHLHGPMQSHGIMLPPSMAGPPPPPPGHGHGHGPYPQMMGGHGPVGPPPPPHLMYGGNGMMPPPHHMQPPHHPAMVPPGAMVPPYGTPGGLMQRPMHYGPMGPGGPAPFPHDTYLTRPAVAPPGLPGPGPMHGMAPRPSGSLYGPGHGPGPALAHQSPAAPQRPFGAQVGPPPPPAQPSQKPQMQQHSGMPPRFAGVLGPGAATGQRPALQARGANGPGGWDSGQQFARGGAPGQPGGVVKLPEALAAAAAALGHRLCGEWMPPADLEYVAKCLLHGVANGVSYVEDYYYQAFVHKHLTQRQQLSPSAFPMAAPFVPEALRSLTADQMRVMRLDPRAHVKFVEGIQGLGKIVLSNIRTPKVLMDLTDRGTEGAGGKVRAAGSAEVAVAAFKDQAGPEEAAASAVSRSARPLEQEPLLAARIMIEDCMNLLLDVEDIDRLATHMAAMAHAHQRAAAMAAALPLPGPAAAVAAVGAAAAAATAAGAPAVGPYGPSSAPPPPLAELRQRRELLLAGVNGAFRLPNAPAGATGADLDGLDMDAEREAGAEWVARGGAGGLGDGVLLRILALSKGRNLVARALMAIVPPASLAAPGPAAPIAATKAAAAAAAAATGHARQDQQQQQQQTEKEEKTEAAAVAVAAAAAEGGGEAAAGDAIAGQDASVEAGGAAGRAAAAPAAAAAPSPSPSPYVLLWGVLRNAWMLFGSSLQQGVDAASERPMVESTGRLAAALRDALLRLPTARDVVAATVAFNTGCQQHTEALLGPGSGSAGGHPNAAAAANAMEATLLPLAQTRAIEAAPSGLMAAAPPAWLGEALAALVTRASQVGLVATAAESGGAAANGDNKDGEAPGATDGTAAAAGREEGGDGAAVELNEEWGREYGQLHERMSRHLTALGGIHSMAAAGGNAEALAVVRALCCRLLVNAMLPHASPTQAQQLREALQAFAA